MTLADHIPQDVIHFGDGVSVLSLLAVWMTWLPHIASLLTVVWVTLRIYETVLKIRKAKKDLR